MPRATPLAVGHGGKLHSKRSKTGDPKCSAAMSAWVLGRKAGNVAASVFKTLAECRGKARQNKAAAARQASGKLASGRGTWQRSEQAAKLRQNRAANRPAPAPAPSADVAPAKAAVKRSKGSTDLSPAQARAGRERLDARSAKSLPSAEFASRATQGAQASPTGGFGDDKTMISHAKAQLDRTDPAFRAMSMPEFKAKLIEAHQAGHLELGRGDLVDAMHQGDVKASSTKHLSAEYHFIRHAPTNKAQSRRDDSAIPDLVAHARSVHAANPGPAMTTHGTHATNAVAVKASSKLTPDEAVTRLKKFQNESASLDTEAVTRQVQALSHLSVEQLKHVHREFLGAVLGKSKKEMLAKIQKKLEISQTSRDRIESLFPTTTHATHVTTRTANLSATLHPVADPLAGTKAESRADRLGKLVQRLRQRSPKLKSQQDPSTHVNHEPGHVGPLDAGLIHVDAHRFQYKLGHGENGSVGSLAGVRRYDPELGGVLQVWKDHGDGKVYVVNGHNRLDLARKLGADQVTVRFIDAKDHHEARAKGALTNIAEGRGTATDAAKFFRDTGHTRDQLEARGIPLREKVATDGIALSKLDDHLFQRVTSGEMTQARGAIIGGSGLEHHEQRALVSLLDKRAGGRGKGGDVSDATLGELTDTVKSSRSVRKESTDLFGSHADDESLALHKARLQATIKDRLGKEKRLFGIVARSQHAEDLARAGNSINTVESGKVSHEASITLSAFDSMKNLSGPVSKRLNDAAQRIHAGENAKKVTDETYRGILKDLPEFLSGTKQLHH